MQQGGSACHGIAWQHFNWYVGAGQLLKKERPCRVVDVDQFIVVAHLRIVAPVPRGAVRRVTRTSIHQSRRPLTGRPPCVGVRGGAGHQSRQRSQPGVGVHGICALAENQQFRREVATLGHTPELVCRPRSTIDSRHPRMPATQPSASNAPSRWIAPAQSGRGEPNCQPSWRMTKIVRWYTATISICSAGGRHHGRPPVPCSSVPAPPSQGVQSCTPLGPGL